MSEVSWFTLPCDAVEFRGLPWIADNLPNLWRLPASAEAYVPERVWRQAKFANGGRLRLRSNTSQLLLHTRSINEAVKSGLDVYVDNQFWGATPLQAGSETDAVCLANAGKGMKNIDIYLPSRHQIELTAIGWDNDAIIEKPPAYSREKPFVLYGSSVAQGIGTTRAGMSYAALLGRMLNLDYVNLGFGGAGKAEAEVVSLVSRIDACCYMLDLGKSYNRQSAAPYLAMLETLRRDHPDTPIICITPIFAAKEFFSAEYVDLSVHTRTVMRAAFAQRAADGDKRLTLVEGEALLSRLDVDGLSGDGVHPNDLGFNIIARRLLPILANRI